MIEEPTYEELELRIKQLERENDEHKQSKELLKIRETQLAESQKVAKLGSWNLNLVTQKLDWSTETYKLFDKEPENFSPSFDEFARVIHPDDFETMQTHFNNALESDDTPYHVQIRIINDSSREWIMEAFGKVNRDKSGHPLGIFGTAQDVTERSRAEESLRSAHNQLEERVKERTIELTQTNKKLQSEIIERRLAEKGQEESEERFRTLMEQSPVAIEIYEPNGILINVNEAWTRFWNLKKEDVKDFNILNDPECERTGLTSAFKEVQQGEMKVLPEIHYDAEESDLTGGRKRWIEAIMYPIKDKLGTVNNIVLTYYDITDRKKFELALKESEQLYRSLVESTTAIAWEVDLESLKFTYISPNVEDILGYPVEMWTNFEFWADRIFPDDKDDAVSFCQTETAKGKDHEFEYRFYSGNGEVVWIKDLVSVVRQKDKPVALRGYLIDITASKYLEKESRKIKNLESIGVLAGGIAHDFNNLLTAVFGNIDIALMSLDPAEEPARFLSESKKALDRSRELTSQLLTFAKGGNPLLKNISIKEVVGDTLSLILSGSNIKYSVDIPDKIWKVSFDEGQMSQIIQNLAINARDAMPNGGAFQVLAENYVQKKNSSLVKKGNFVLLKLQDEGSGINQEALDKIFDPYFSTKKRGSVKGTGLGLAICHSIITKHNGYINVESSDDGTTFLLYIPAPTPKVELPTIDDSQKQIIEKSFSGRILVLEDEIIVGKVLEKMLEATGYSAEIVLTGEDAVEKYTTAHSIGTPYDLVILDLTIKGGMGGAETMKKLLDVDPTVKAIVASGYADNSLLANYQDYGFQAAIAKPYTLKSLKKTFMSLSKAH